MKKVISFFSLTFIVFLIGIGTLILAPQPLFSNAYQYQTITVYSNYSLNKPMLNKHLDDVITLLRETEMYDPEYTYDVFFANETFYNKIDNLVFGEWSAARSIDNNVIIKNGVNEEKGVVENGENQFELTYVLAHEMVHCLQNNRYGVWKFNPLSHPPFWKLEGYPEYIARKRLLKSDGYDLRREIQKFLNRTSDNIDNHGIIQISENESTPYIYYKGRLMMEYLIDVKEFSYDEILKKKFEEEEVFEEMMNWGFQ